jgi:hypothetical protein
MKRFFGIAAIILFSSIPAHAQSRVGGSSSATINFGGGSVGGGAVTTDFGHLPTYSPRQFASAAISGDESSFAPSSFMSFEDAVKEGIAESRAAKSVAQAAADNQAAIKAKSRVEFVQDHSGNVIPVTR